MTRNQQLYERARRLFPWGTQTNAKRPDAAHLDVMPLFIDRAEGCRIRDVDGRWFIDYRSSLGPMILGHHHPDVDAAVRRQFEEGVLFSMASPLEIEVAERLVALVPGLEQVRFLKTGNEANGAAVRLARAFTGRDHLATCGYHGHGDWFACGQGEAPAWFAREGNGVPRALDALVTRLPYGDLEAANRLFDTHGDRLAAVMTVPYDWNEHVGGDFLALLRERTRACGALLLFDQVLTGFRLARGGAQEYFGIVPDLTTYAKALANGYPLAAFGGRRDVMAMLDRVVITSTYAGETLSLAAAAATLDVLRHTPALDHLWAMGRRLQAGFDAAAAALGLPYRSFGLPPAVQFRFGDDPAADERLRQHFFHGLYERGIFAARPFLLSAAHHEADIDETVAAMQSTLEALEPASA